ncbi:MAG: ComEC/Rec2 family competence protein, partial [Patescibacteria group bacterium]
MSPKLIILALAFLSVILAIRVSYYLLSFKPYPANTKIAFETQLSNQPKMSSRGQKVSLTLPNSQRVGVNFALLPILNYGDKVKLEGKIQYFKTPEGKEIAFMNYPRFSLIEAESQSNLIYRIRLNIISFFNSSLGQTESALMLGIVFGIKEEMPANFYDNLQKTGLLHVIAASGMNVTMVGGFLVSLLTIFFRRQLALVLTIFGILFYALLAGFEPSIVRAAIMGILVLFAQLLGRQNSAFVGLFGAGFIMIFINPSLVY